MAKNNALMSAMKAYRKQFDRMIPMMYASMALALHDEGFGFTRISRVFARSQALWEEASESPEHGYLILRRCLEVTGIDVQYGLSTKPEEGWSR